MKTFEEIINEAGYRLEDELMYTQDVLILLKQVHDQAVDLCAENVRLMDHCSHQGVIEIRGSSEARFDPNTEIGSTFFISKESIIKVKDLL